jgi:heme-degrading monooxygenase HmoA
MFSVMFEVQPRPEQWEAYLGYARMLRPELEQIDGFLDNIRYRSLTRPGWLLSLSGWRDEKALVRWRTTANHHGVQEKGRAGVLLDYHLRVGQVTRDTGLAAGQSLREQRFDETETGAGTTVTLIDGNRAADWVKQAGPQAVADSLGLAADAPGLIAWDVFDAVLAAGQVILLLTWRGVDSAEAFERSGDLSDRARLRRVRIIRDYGMFDRREAPQYYPAVARPAG